ncbi:MAG TPA: hypothetical protein VNJ01_06520 [Bacteriovoracaceae bacterium]|nr:hypothetical protein [Bacteriovoracaceae bacterium]
MNSKRIDHYLLILGLLLVVVSSYQLFFTVSSSGAGTRLGKLSAAVSVVKIKNALGLDWNDAQSGSDLLEDQLLYTDKASSAAIVFSEGGELDVQENSLIRLRSIGKQQTVALEKGFLRARIDEKNPLTVQLNGKDYLLKGSDAEVQINLKDQKGVIGVIRGEVSLEGNGRTEKLTTSSALEIDGARLSKKTISVRLVSPGTAEVIYTAAPELEVDFEWSPNLRGGLVLSPTPGFENTQSHQADGKIKLNLAPGQYYWKIAGEAGGSLVSSFQIVQEQKPEVLRPLSGDTLTVFEGEKTEALLQWNGKSTQKYRLEWNDGAAQVKEVTGTNLLIGLSGSGPLKWKVKLSDPTRPLAPWSEEQLVKVEFLPLPQTPQELAPDGFEFLSYTGPVETVSLSWKSDLPCEVEVLTPENKRTVSEVTTQLFEFKSAVAGRHNWRIRSLDSRRRSSAWSDWKHFEVTDLSGEKLEGGFQRIQLDRPDQVVTFTWESTQDSVSDFELSKDKEFTEVVNKQSGKPSSARVVVAKTGVYYWRSRQIQNDGRVHVTEPKRVLIEPAPGPLKPSKLPDMEVPLKTQTPEPSGGLWDWLVAKAHAGDGLGSVEISVPKNQNAKRYVIRIFKDLELKQLAREISTEKESFLWEDARAGSYYWQYSIVDFWDRKSLFSDPAVLRVREDVPTTALKPKLAYPIRAVKIESKDLKFGWSRPAPGLNYKLEVSASPDFEKPVVMKALTLTEVTLPDSNLSPGLYFWRVTAGPSEGSKVVSNTGRFEIEPPLERIIIAQPPPARAWSKDWKSRGLASWTPSLDHYEFGEGAKKGEIEGSVTQGIRLSANLFFEKTVLSAVLDYSNGKVFASQRYSNLGFSLDFVKSWNLTPDHRIGAGAVAGFSRFEAYRIVGTQVVSETSSGLVYGAILRDFYALNGRWELQSKLQVLTGEFTEFNGSVDLLYHYRAMLLLGGIGCFQRNIDLSEGEQRSMNFSVGIGKEF